MKSKRNLGANKYFSLVKKLRKSNKLTSEFEAMFNSLTLEEVIGLKLELAAHAAGGKLYGVPLWKSMPDISKEAVYNYALSICSTKREAASFLGIDLQTLNKLEKKYDTKNYFKDFKIYDIG